jgi:hypothetical protein
MSGYVSSWIEQYTTGMPTGCGVSTPNTPEVSNCLLYVIVGVVFMSLAFEKKRKVSTK